MYSHLSNYRTAAFALFDCTPFVVPFCNNSIQQPLWQIKLFFKTKIEPATRKGKPSSKHQADEWELPDMEPQTQSIISIPTHEKSIG